MQKQKPILIAIDGPASAGKTTIASRLSKRLGILYLNTGAMYRTAGLQALRSNLDPLNEEQVLTFLNHLKIDVKYENGKQQTYLNDENVTNLLMTEEVSAAASQVSSLLSVRKKMVALQKSFAEKQSIIIDGRDIGTVVLPNAQYKFYLDASVEERARRRYNEYHEKGQSEFSYERILADIKERDFRDTNREFSPLKPADDAIIIDTTNKTLDEVEKEIFSHIKR
ncbi:MAG: (d)CMP kinase [Spirochaetales bacterium]